MALTKSSTVVHDDITLTAGAGDTTSSTQTATGNYQHTARVRFTNGATGPTIMAQCKVQTAEADTAAKYMTLVTLFGGNVNNAVTEYNVDIPATASYIRFVSGTNTGQNVTLRVVLDTITAV